MNAKEYLEQIASLDTRIKNKQIEKLQWEEIASGMTSNIDSERVTSSGAKSKMEEAVLKAVGIEEDIFKLIEERRSIINTIGRLKSNHEYNVVHMKYVRHMEFWEIAEACHKSESWVFSIHREGLRNVQKILDEVNDDR